MFGFAFGAGFFLVFLLLLRICNKIGVFGGIDTHIVESIIISFIVAVVVGRIAQMGLNEVRIKN